MPGKGRACSLTRAPCPSRRTCTRFLGANGIDTRFGITTASLAESAKKQAVVARSKYVYVLMDSSKFHQVTAIQTLDPADVTVISDRGDEELEALTTLIYE